MTKRRKRQSIDKADAETDIVTPEFLQHHTIESVTVTHFGDGKEIKPHRAVTKRNTDQRLIDRYLRGHNISEAQHNAAGRFYLDWYLQGLEPRVTANLMATGGGKGGGDGGTQSQVAARQRHRQALNALDLPDHGFVIDIVCFDQPVGGEAMKNRITIRTRFDRLRSALDRLARHYGVWVKP